MEIKIEKIDHLGRGIGYIDGKICFVPFTVIGDIVDINIIKENKNYIEAQTKKNIKSSIRRVEPKCPYFGKCGGCQFLNVNYEETLKYKLDRVQNILKSFNYNKEIAIVKSDNPFNYRNKIELKFVNGQVGFYKNKSNDIVSINKCIVASESLNNGIDLLKKFNIINGDVILRCNYNNELLIIIDTQDHLNIDDQILPDYKVVGIILNDQVIYGENHFLEKINNHFFDVSYDSFFQINRSINEKLCTFVADNVEGNVLDLYCGVGTLSLSCSKNAKQVIGIEVVKNAIVNAVQNKKINKNSNCEFILGKVEDKIKFIKDRIDTIIVDPPRRGLDDVTIKTILQISPKKIIYISCDTFSLVNNLEKLIEDYNIDLIKLFDMFPFTYHTECAVILTKK